MPFAKVTFTVGLGLFLAAAFGITGTWGLVTSTIVMGLAGLVAVIAMEEHDLAGVEGLYPEAQESAAGLVAETAAVEPLAQAA